MRVLQDAIDFFQAGARFTQHGVELHNRGTRFGQHAFVAEHLRVGLGGQPINLGGHAVQFGQQAVGAVQRDGDFFCLGLATQQHRQRAARSVQPSGQRLQIRQAGADGAAAAGQAAEVFNQVFGGSNHLRNFGRGITRQQRAFGPIGQQRVIEQPGVGADVGAAHDAAHQREHARGAQPVRVFGCHVDQNARLAVGSQLDLPHPANREARKSDVFADHHALGVVGDQHQSLRAFKSTACIQHKQGRTAHQHQHEDHQQTGLQHQIGHRRRRRRAGLRGLQRVGRVRMGGIV